MGADFRIETFARGGFMAHALPHHHSIMARPSISIGTWLAFVLISAMIITMVPRSAGGF